MFFSGAAHILQGLLTGTKLGSQIRHESSAMTVCRFTIIELIIETMTNNKY